MNKSTARCRALLILPLIILTWNPGNAVSADSDARSTEEIQQEIAALEEHIAYREERLAELTNDMLSLDERTEKRIGRILESITKVTDSQESQTTVARTKQEAIEALKTCSEHYKSRRKSLKMETMKYDPQITREDLFKDIGRFDERIDDRIDQVIAITNSMQLHQDYEKWRGYDGYGLWRNDRFYHNRKETRRTEDEREQLMEELQDDIEAVELRNREIQKILEGKITPQYRVMLMDELDGNLEKIEKRQEHIEKAAFPDKPQTSPVGRAQAINIGSVVGNMAEDLDRDCRTIWQTYIEINREREFLKQLHERLIADQGALELKDAETDKPKPAAAG